MKIEQINIQREKICFNKESNIIDYSESLLIKGERYKTDPIFSAVINHISTINKDNYGYLRALASSEDFEELKDFEISGIVPKENIFINITFIFHEKFKCNSINFSINSSYNPILKILFKHHFVNEKFIFVDYYDKFKIEKFIIDNNIGSIYSDNNIDKNIDKTQTIRPRDPFINSAILSDMHIQSSILNSALDNSNNYNKKQNIEENKIKKLEQNNQLLQNLIDQTKISNSFLMDISNKLK